MKMEEVKWQRAKQEREQKEKEQREKEQKERQQQQAGAFAEKQAQERMSYLTEGQPGGLPKATSFIARQVVPCCS